MKKVDAYPAKPFVKWVGGKTQLLEDIKKALPMNMADCPSLKKVDSPDTLSFQKGKAATPKTERLP